MGGEGEKVPFELEQIGRKQASVNKHYSHCLLFFQHQIIRLNIYKLYNKEGEREKAKLIGQFL
jgi:hypothetical protein